MYTPPFLKMELIERPNLDAIAYLNSISFETFRNDCIQEAEEQGCKSPVSSDIKSWYEQLKQFCKTNIKTKGITKRIYSYSSKTPAGLGGRLFCGNSMQGIWSVYRGLLMRGIGTDIDMCNAHPVILRYVCNKHNIDCPSLEYYINNRDRCLTEFDSRAIAKQAYLSATNNDKLSRRKDAPIKFKNYDREMKDIQNQLLKIPEYQELFDTIPEYRQSKNYNGCAINRILCYYENIIIQHAIHVINKRGIEIAILMFDGLMIYGEHHSNSELLQEIEQYVESQMPSLGMKWLYKEHDESLTIPSDFDPKLSLLAESRNAEDDISAARIILSDLSGIIVYSNNRMFIKKDNLWISEDSDVQNFLLHFILTSDVRRLNEKGKFIPYAQNDRAASSIRKVLITMVRETAACDEQFYGKLHSTTKGRLCFKNGVYDFKTAQFYTWDKIPFEYYSTQMIPIDYPRTVDRSIMNTIKESIFEPLFGDKIKEALQFLSRAIAGHCEDKNWASYLGNRDCGKGVIYDLLKLSFGNYIQTFELNHIMYQRDRPDTSEATRKLYWLMDFEFTRLAISQETPDRKSQLKVNSKLLKKLAGGGDTHVARRNYDRQDTHFLIDTTFMIMGNEAVQVDSEDAFEHCLQLSSYIQFKTEQEIEDQKQLYPDLPQLWNKYKVRDPTIKDKCRSLEWQLATIQLLIESYTSQTLSVVVKEETYDNDEVPLTAMIAQLYDFTGSDSDSIPVDDVVASLNQTKKKVITEMKGLGIEKRRSKSSQHRDKICFYGLREKLQIIITADS